MNDTDRTIVGLYAAPGADPDQTRALAAVGAAGPGFPLLQSPPEAGAYLALTGSRLELRLAGAGMQPLFVDFNARGIIRRVHAGRRSLLGRALGLHRRPGLNVLDATCGLGRDAALLLALGCGVYACERSPALAALLTDGLRRGAHALPAQDWLCHWLGLHEGDAVACLREAEHPAIDAVYLDPMFGGTGRNALPKREMQMLHAAVGEDTDAHTLLTAACASDAGRVVVKRHPRHPPLAQPSYTLDGGRVRFDVYIAA